MSFSLSLNTPPDKKDAAARPARVEAPRPQYIELKANVHRKLLNRLNLEALASTERSRAEADIRALALRPDCRREHAAQHERARRDSRRRHRRGLRARAARAAAARYVGQRHPGQHLQERLRRAQRQAGPAADDVPGRQAPDARHRPHRQRRRPARRRQLADGRRAPGGRLPCQRDHSAARGRRPAALDPPFSGRAPARRGSGRDPLADAADARVPRVLRPRAAERAHQRRHRRRQDDAAQRAVGLHLRARAHRHDRRRGRAPAAPGARRPARDAAAERRRQGRDPSAAAAHQRPAYAARPHRRRRGPRRGSARHAPGDEHRSRRVADDRPRQLAARRADPCRDDDLDGQRQPARARDAAPDRVGDPARRASSRA